MSSYADKKWQGKLKQYCHDNNHRQLEEELFERASGEATLRPGLSTLKCFGDHGELFLGRLMALACAKDHLESGQVLVGALSKEQLNGEYKWKVPGFLGNSWTFLHISAGHGSARLAQLLLTHGCMIDAKDGDYGGTAMYVASGSGHEKVVAILLQHGADVNAADEGGWTALYSASEKGHEKVVALLLEHGADANAVTEDGWNALHTASGKGHEKVVALLLQHGADVTVVNKNGFTSMYIASQNGHEKVVALLLQHGADVNVVNKDGFPSIYVASQNGHEKVVALLLQHGAEVNAVNKNGSTSMYIASQNGHEKVVALLLQHGAEVNAVTKDGFTSLHVASAAGQEKVVASLLQHGAEVNAVSKGGQTALHVASYKGKVEVMHLLLQHKADVLPLDKYGDSALDNASTQGHHECVSVLMEHMSKMYSYDKMTEIVVSGSEKARKNYEPRCLNYIEKFLHSNTASVSAATTASHLIDDGSASAASVGDNIDVTLSDSLSLSLASVSDLQVLGINVAKHLTRPERDTIARLMVAKNGDPVGNYDNVVIDFIKWHGCGHPDVWNFPGVLAYFASMRSNTLKDALDIIAENCSPSQKGSIVDLFRDPCFAETGPWKRREYKEAYGELIRVMHPTAIKVACYSLQLINDYHLEDINALTKHSDQNAEILKIVSRQEAHFGPFREILHYHKLSTASELDTIGPDRDLDEACLRARQVLSGQTVS